jgi:hypothetical protein
MTTKVSEFKVGYLGIGSVLGIGAAVLTFICAYIYCIATYGFLLGLGLGWLPSLILAALIGGATVFLWAPALVLGLLFAATMLVALSPKLLVGGLFGAAVGWLVWRVAPKALSGRQ